MAVDFKTFLSVASHIADVRKPILLRGRHGVGKSEVVYQFAKAVGLPMIERRASQMTEGDLVGLPKIDADRTEFMPPDWFKEACDHPVLLFFDEVDRAVTEVRQGLFELTDSRKIFGRHLHPDTLIFAAVNGGEHAAQYQVADMDPAEIDRWVVFDVEPSVEDFLDWGKTHLHLVMWDFANQNRSHLQHDDNFEPGKVYPSRRSVKRLNDCLDTAGQLDREDPDLTKVYHLANAFCGSEFAVVFRDFVQNYDRQVTVEDILNEGKFEKVKDFGINDFLSLIEKMEATEVFKSEMTDIQIQNLAKLFVTVPSELAVKLFELIGGSGIVKNLTRFHNSTVDDRKISSVFVELVTGNKS